LRRRPGKGDPALDWKRTQLVRHASNALGVAAGYFVLGFIGTVLSVPPSGFAIIWPATAFLLAVMMLTPARRWWIYPITVVPTHFAMVAIFEPVSFAVALTQIGGNFALAASTALALRATNGRPPDFANFRTLLRFILIAGIGVPIVLHAAVLLVHMANGRTDDFWLSWRQWMVATVTPTITIPPVVVLAAQRIAARQLDWAYLRELGVLSLALFASSLLAFGGGIEPQWRPALLLTPLPFLLWAAVRLGVGGTAAAVLVFAGALIADAFRAEGPFAELAPAGDLISIQVFLNAISIPSMLLAALLEDRRRTEDLLRRSEARMSVVAASTEAGLWQWDERTKSLWLTDHCRSMFGIAAGAEVTPPMILAAVHPEDRARVARALRTTLSSADATPREFRVQRPDGELRWLTFSTHTQFDRENRPILVSGMFQDVTQLVGAQDEAENLTRRLLTLQDDERRSIARELHDYTAQHLVAAELNLGALRRTLALPDEARRLMDSIGVSLQRALSELRTFTFLLQPPELDDEPLSTTLRRYVEGFGRRTGLKTGLRVNPLADLLSAEQRRTVLRVVQEGLANVHRHAGATSVSVNVRRIGRRLHVVINDDGSGDKRLFERRAGEHLLGVSVPGMAARIRQLGGKIEVSSRPAGATVHVAIPIGEDAAT
jgi:PAS domain S-box-containing protein